MFRLNEVYQYHKEELRLVLKRRQMLGAAGFGMERSEKTGRRRRS